MSLSLAKGSSLSLVKSNGSAITEFTLGLGWDEKPAEQKKGFFGKIASVVGAIDLDASAILFDANKNVVDIVSFSQKKSKDGSVKHGGDNLTGAGDGDDETIVVKLAKVDANVNAIVFVITSYSGQKFDQLSNVFARVIEGSQEVVRYNLADGGNHTAKIVAKVSREGAGWSFTAVGNDASGKVAKDVISDAAAAA